MRSSLFQYATTDQINEFILSLHLLDPDGWTEQRKLGCLYAVSNHTHKHYRTLQIPKKNGSLRRIDTPDALLKRIQKNILHHILDGLSVSPYAAAYQKKNGILSASSPHAGRHMILKLDISDFYGHILFPMVYHRAFPADLFPPAAAGLLTSLCCLRDRLPQGAPTSPAISNLILRPFDDYMGAWCASQDIAYTRYCDDMTFSGDFSACSVKNKVQGFLNSMGFSLNDKKTAFVPSSCRQIVTGVVVNCRPQASRSYRSLLRQDLYYCQKYGIADHLSRIQKRPVPMYEIERYRMSLLGRIQFILSVNPEDSYFKRMKETFLTRTQT